MTWQVVNNDNQVGAEYKGSSNITEADDMASYINGLGWKTYTSSTDTAPKAVTVTSEDVTRELAAAGVSIDTDGNFTLPAKGFYYTVTATNPKNGKTSRARVYFPGDNAQTAYPVIWYYENGKDSKPTPIQEGSHSFNKMPVVEVTQGDTNWKAYDNFASTQSYNNNTTMPLSSQQVTNNNVNVNVPGLYNVTLNVTNSDGKTTQLTYSVAVRSGDKNAKSNVKVNYVSGYGVNLYHLYGSEPSYIGQHVAADSNITVYINDTKTINGVSYTRVDGYGDNVWIQTQYLDGSWKANKPSNNKPSTSSEEKASGIATVTYKGRGGVNLLNAEGKYQNQYVKKGSAWKVFAKKTINGETMYRLGTQSQ
ncbi:MAG: hypothetical protein LKG31_04015, partial [Lactobacillus sp.]|nr:hypothetical protein [Lactobacillus sp.]